MGGLVRQVGSEAALSSETSCDSLIKTSPSPRRCDLQTPACSGGGFWGPCTGTHIYYWPDWTPEPDVDPVVMIACLGQRSNPDSEMLGACLWPPVPLPKTFPGGERVHDILGARLPADGTLGLTILRLSSSSTCQVNISHLCQQQ